MALKRYRKLVDKRFLEGLHNVANPPFCFSCGNRVGRCCCKQGPLPKSEWQAMWLNREKSHGSK